MLDSKTRMGKQNWVNSFFWFYPYSSLTKMLKISTQNFCLWKFINLFLFNRKHTLYETKTEGNFLIIIIIISAQNGPFNEWILGILFPNQSSQVFFNENYEKTPKWIMDFLFLLVMFWTRQKKEAIQNQNFFSPNDHHQHLEEKKFDYPEKHRISIWFYHTHTHSMVFSKFKFKNKKKPKNPKTTMIKTWWWLWIVVVNSFIH